MLLVRTAGLEPAPSGEEQILSRVPLPEQQGLAGRAAELSKRFLRLREIADSGDHFPAPKERLGNGVA